MSDKAKYGYLAGVVDGEGTLTVCRNTFTKRRTRLDGSLYERECIHYGAVCAVTNTNLALMEFLKSRFGGNYYPLTRNGKKVKPNWKLSYRWQLLSQKEIEMLLLATMPYLILKKDQANLLLEFVRMSGQFVPEKRQEIYEKVRALNQRGMKEEETNVLAR